MKACQFFFILLLVFSSCSGLFFDERPTDNVSVLDAFFEEIQSHYSFFEVIPFDEFESEYQAQRGLLINTPDTQQLEASLQVLVDLLQDGHTDVYGPNQISYDGWFSPFPQNELSNNENYFTDYRRVNNALEFGKVRDQNIGYIRIPTFGQSGREYAAIDEVLRQIGDTDAIIIDVRSNGGGNTLNADFIISRFNDLSRLQHEESRRTGGLSDFGPWPDVLT